MSSDAALLATVRASPDAVAVHDKAAWVGLFAADGEVNDPVGSRPHVGRAAIERFYETFIAPNDIRFEVDQDLVCGATVVRDVVIETRMATGLRVAVPAHIRYELVETGGGPRIRRLCAHWELLPMVGQTLRGGLRGMRTQLLLGARMLACQGPGGVLGFMRAFRGVGRRGKRRAESLLAAAARGDAAAVAAGPAAGAVIELPAGTPARPADLAGLRGLTWHKTIAAGRTVTATVAHEGVRGVVLLEFGRRRRIERVVFYFPDDR